MFITTAHQQPAHTLLAALTHDLPIPKTPSPDRNRAEHLLRQRNGVLAQLHDIATTAQQLNAIAEHNRVRGRDHDRNAGLEL
ncbi:MULTISPECIES: hypothetical protein [unclassified Mycobacterium]|uniref:hypothetical protein n=1 Tax=unclassified Mycobacterium TaxID=2642494 RepID=UPI0012EA1E7F|nr:MULTISPECIES: hypothetical protein [unclassified Mycobacterium]